jgi:hypothetical protein
VPKYCPSVGFECPPTHNPPGCPSVPPAICPTGGNPPICRPANPGAPFQPHADQVTAPFWQGPRTGVFNPYGG